MTVRSSSEALSIEFERGVLTLTINDPPRNRMTFEYMDAVEQAVDDAGERSLGPGARVHRHGR